MNVSELARILRVNQKDLLELLPKMGFDVGKRAIKIDQRLAQRIIKEWKSKIAELDRQQRLQESEKIVEQATANAGSNVIRLPAVITVREFSEALHLPITQVIRELMNQGILATVNERIDFDTASIIAQDLGFTTASADQTAEEAAAPAPQEEQSSLKLSKEEGTEPRPPVVVVMGHIDHGKTKLLDAIRRTRVMESESGGITQHIGAYQTERRNRKITFIDTPGHEAFMTMRARGAKVADIAILVVAADDGVQPQTKEAVNIIRASGLPMIVAMNKIDKPEANIDKTKKELADIDILAEDYGGKVPMVPISAREGRGIDDLLEMVLLVADLEKEKIRSNPNRPAVGSIIESRLDKHSGPFATVLVQAGTLRVNDPLVIGSVLYGKVRNMKDDLGKTLTEALPGTPVAILGFKVVPAVGDVVEVSAATELARRSVLKHDDRTGQLLRSFGKGKTEEQAAMTQLNLIVKADVLGSLEAILSELEKSAHAEVGVTVISRGLGSINDADVLRAASENARILGFHVHPTGTAAMLARDKGVSIEEFDVIYHLLDAVKRELQILLAPRIQKTTIGTIRVAAIFKRSGKTTIVGGRVEEGKIPVKVQAEVMRAGQSQGFGVLAELQAGKQSVNHVSSGQECGVRFEGKVELLEGDALVAFKEETVERTLEAA